MIIQLPFIKHLQENFRPSFHSNGLVGSEEMTRYVDSLRTLQAHWMTSDPGVIKRKR